MLLIIFLKYHHNLTFYIKSRFLWLHFFLLFIGNSPLFPDSVFCAANMIMTTLCICFFFFIAIISFFFLFYYVKLSENDSRAMFNYMGEKKGEQSKKSIFHFYQIFRSRIQESKSKFRIILRASVKTSLASTLL